ncbi:MAG TPA: PQQ-binding-like beta-propeller repeat protein, partial [Dehalococcoidia bacterium]|nr:PQQ-binding-like beta-propeller repeat protein [Dehalococcoidia bacterium]
MRLLTRTATILAIAVISLAIAACGDDDDGPGTDGFPPEIADNEDQWPLANHDYDSTRAAVNAEINSENVDDLGVGWTFEIPLANAPFGAAASIPLIANDTVYFMDLESNFYAIDLETGEEVWSTEYNNTIVGPNGPAIGYGKVFGLSSPRSMVALDADTGEEIWARDLDHPTNIQPIVFDNKVFFGHVAGGDGSYEGGTSGYAVALDQETGEEVWSFQTVEEDFWGNPEVNSGAGIWFPPSIDPDSGLVYYGTGNPAPFPGIEGFPNGESRPGDNLYSNSLIALDIDSGDLEWYNQLLPHDIFDLDVHLSPVIIRDIESRGEERDLVIATGKIARVFGIDADSHDIVWDAFVGTHINDKLHALPLGEEVEVAPGTLGGIETPVAYADGVVYTPSLTLPTIHTATSFGATDGTEALRNAITEDPQNGTGEISAIDVSTGEVIWVSMLPGAVFGGATVVNDLVFTSTFDGTIYAMDRENGEIVFEHQAPGGINGQPAVAGDTIIFPAGLGSSPQLVALRLGGEPGDTPT